MWDVIIAGGGPAGLSASIFAVRSGMKAVVLEENYICGGQLINSYTIDNYPGIPGVSGVDLGMKMREHAEGLGVIIRNETISSMDLHGDTKIVTTNKDTYEARTVILAMGCSRRRLELEGENVSEGYGVSYNAAADGPFYQGSDVAVIGGGDSAAEDALFLASVCHKVYMIHRHPGLKAIEALQTKLASCDNVEMVMNSEPVSIEGENQTGAVWVKNLDTDERRCLHVDGVFIAAGIRPHTEILQGQVELDSHGFIRAGEDGRTSVEGVFAVGDIRTKHLRQTITACADGANAVDSARTYLAHF